MSIRVLDSSFEKIAFKTIDSVIVLSNDLTLTEHIIINLYCSA